jgi:hypothetical protein
MTAQEQHEARCSRPRVAVRTFADHTGAAQTEPAGVASTFVTSIETAHRRESRVFEVPLARRNLKSTAVLRFFRWRTVL